MFTFGSSLTLGVLLKHLAVCEDNMFTVRRSGAPIGVPWEGTASDGMAGTGHADLLREAVHGRVGKDPPAGWCPRAGRYRVVG
jgi:hypothetical protein